MGKKPLQLAKSNHLKNKTIKNRTIKKDQQEELIQKETKTSNLFAFDLDTSISAKFSSDDKYHNKSSYLSSWNYSDIIQTEEAMQKTKENKKKAFLKLEDREIKGDRSHEQEEEKENENIDMTPEDAMIIDKFENAVYAKGISFTTFNLSKLIIKGLSEMEYYTPTKVQEKVIPVALKGHDILVNSETGSGKTACFLLPIIQRILSTRTTKNSSHALILVPTRELALQCNEMLFQLSKYIDISFIFLCGGMSVENQMTQLKTVLPEIIISTPGRLIDMLYNYNSITLEKINILVLDEADKLLELGFKDAIMEILEVIKNNPNRQTMLFSATLNPKIIDLGKHALINPIKVKIAQSAILTNLNQSICRIKFENMEENPFEKRMTYLINIIKEQKLSRTIIFFNTKDECHKSHLVFNSFSLSSVELHSNIQQSERIKALDKFQKGNASFLLATDIAGRGIDIDKVRCVINFQMPLIGDRYIHRIGRTARKGYLGMAITICDDKDRLVLKKFLRKEKISVQLNSIKVENGKIKAIYKLLIKSKAEIEAKIDEDKADRELQMAEVDIDKTINIKMFQDDIQNRPKKKWYESKKDKSKKRKEMQKVFTKQKKELYS